MTKIDSKKLKPIPCLGVLKLLKYVIPSIQNVLPTGVKMHHENGDIINVKLSGKSNMIMVNHPDYVQHILKTDPDNYSRKKVIGSLSGLLGDGLFNSEGALWEQQHQLIKPTLHEKLVSDYYDVIHEETDILIKNWDQKAKTQKNVDIEYDINVMMLKILIRTQLSPSATVDFKEIIKSLRVFIKQSNPLNFVIRKSINETLAFFKLPLLKNKKSIAALKHLDQLINSIRTEAKKNPENIGLVLKTLEDAYRKNMISDKQVNDEIKNFFFAGFDTTATALTWTLFCYAKHKKQAQVLQTEILEVLKNNPPRYEQMNDLPYNKMFIQESLRLYPPVFLIPRMSLAQDDLNGYNLPKKNWIGINVYALHRHPKFWKKPEDFDPMRFERGNFKGKAFAYIPFGQGKRMCIGKALAMTELQVILPRIVQHFNLELVDEKEPVISPDIIIKSRKKLLMKLTPKQF